MKAYIFESPKKEKRRSGIVREDEVRRIAHLKSKGWRIVERFEVEVEGETEATPLPPSATDEKTPAYDSGDSDLAELTVAELKEVAAGLGVDLEGLTRKAEIVSAVELHQENSEQE